MNRPVPNAALGEKQPPARPPRAANENAFAEDHSVQPEVGWREVGAVIAGLVVLLVTAWLIWGTFAEAASAFAEGA